MAVCRAVAAAVLGDSNAVKFTPQPGKHVLRVASGEIDVLSRNTTWTYSRDVDWKFTFAGVNYYDGQGFIAPKSLGINSAKDLGRGDCLHSNGDNDRIELGGFLPFQWHFL